MFRREDKCTQVNKLEKLECKWKLCNAKFYAAKPNERGNCGS